MGLMNEIRYNRINQIDTLLEEELLTSIELAKLREEKERLLEINRKSLEINRKSLNFPVT